MIFYINPMRNFNYSMYSTFIVYIYPSVSLVIHRHFPTEAYLKGTA